jgi:hypothetical protein
VFAVGHPLLAPLGRETAALLACSTPAVLSHLTAARLWDLPAPESEEIHVTVDRRHATKRAGIRSHRVRWLAHDDVCRHYRLPLTTVRRTLLDLAEHLSLRDLERATDQALGRPLVSRAALGRALELAPGRRGGARLRCSGGSPGHSWPTDAPNKLSLMAETLSKEAVGARLGEIRAQLKLLADYL